MFKKVLVLLLGILLIIFGILRLKRDKAVEEPGYLKFMNGNSLVKENKTKEALEEYKLAMDTNEDINIKKNFEIIKNKVDEEKQNQQQDNQQNQDQKNNENQQQNQQQDQQNKNNSQDNNKQNDQKNNEQNNKDKKDDQQQNQQENQNDSQNNEPNKGSTPKELTPEEKAMKQKEEELRSIMQRLEGNEKQAFKNNERVLNTSENKNSENRW